MSFLYKLIIFLENLIIKLKILHFSNIYKCKINFIFQGEGGLVIECNKINKSNYFQIDITSHLKSNTYIECTGGVKIGKYFHTGRGLTILTTNHDYNSEELIPYGRDNIEKAVIIDSFVWLGNNVTILPGVNISEGVVVGASSVVTKSIPKGAIVAGNPARIIKYRNMDLFVKLKSEGKYF